MLLTIFKAAAVIRCRTDVPEVVWGSGLGQRTRVAVKWTSEHSRALYFSVRHKTYNTDDAMVRILNVAEKNDAAKSLSDIMSAGRYTKVTCSLVTGRFAPSSVYPWMFCPKTFRPWTYLTFHAYSFITQAPRGRNVLGAKRPA